MTHPTWGPRLAAEPTGPLRAALAVLPAQSIERARPLPGEPNAVYHRAAAQHEIFVKTLRYFNCEVTVLPAVTHEPYASAIADAAVVYENGVVMMRPNAPSRREQVAPLEAKLAELDVPIAGHVAAPGFLDGSDVLMAGKTVFIGASARSNTLGRKGFAQIAKAHGFETVEVRLAPDVPCLRAVAGAAAADTVVLAPEDRLDHAAFAQFERLVTPRGHDLGAGVLPIGERHVIADVRFRSVNDMLRKHGIAVEALDFYDFDRIGLTPSMLVVDLKRG